MKKWLKDGSFRSLLKNTSYQALSKALAAICSVAALAFAGRGLGPSAFGLLVVIQSYVQSASGIAKFQSWQLVVRFGSAALSENDPGPLKEATGFAIGLDLISAIVGSVAAIALLPTIGPWLHIPPAMIPYAMAYCLLLPTMAAATPAGILRALDRFDLIGWQSTVTPILRGLMAFAAWLAGAPLLVYLAIWFASSLCGEFYAWFMAWRELRRRGFNHGIRLRLRPRQLPGAWKFAINVNLSTSLNATAGPAANLIVGAILGPAAAGIFRIARSIAQSIESPADFLEKAFYPEVLRQDLNTKRPWNLMLRSAVVAAFIGTVMVAAILIGGRYLIPVIFGAQYGAAYPVVAIMVFATFIAAVTFPVVPMLYAMNRAPVTLVAKFLGTSIFLLGLFPLCRWAGVPGAGMAFVLGDLTALAIDLSTLWREYVRRVGRPAMADQAAL
ncbi:MAG: lipopolysaccharide biosynthesis protein [Pseudomonadota bacterium]|nr:lipopolysaccharide biosynthesis protein [Pseudomonadota bacterium]